MRSLTIERTTAVLIFALIFALAARTPIDTDTWWHIRSGEHTLTQGMIYADPFSHTFAGEPWINHSWGSQIILYGAWSLAGYLGLTVYMAALATGGMYFIFRMSEGSVYLRGFALILGAAAAAVFWSPRPQMLSFFLSAVVLYILWLYRTEKTTRGVWLIPPIMALWGNLHAGFSIGFIFMAGVIAGEIAGRIFAPKANYLTWRKIGVLILVGLVSAAALVINPYGLNMLLVPFQTVGIGALRQFIQEWNSPNFQGRETWAFIFLLVGILGAAGASARRLNWTDFFLVSGTAFMSFLYGRNIAVFAVAATPVLTYHLDSILTERGLAIRPLRRVRPAMAVINLVIIVIAVFGAFVKTVAVVDDDIVQPALETIVPVEAVAYLRDNQPTGTMFNSYNWGGYLIYALREYPVFVDGRTDLYGDAFLQRYLQIAIGGDEWREGLDEYGVNLVLMERDSGLSRRLRDEPGWNEVYTDDTAAVFVREESIP